MNKWQIVQFRPCDVDLSSSEKTQTGLYKLEAGGSVGRLILMYEDESKTNGLVHRFKWRKNCVNVIAEFDNLLNQKDFKTQINEYFKELEIPEISKLLSMLPDEVDLNNEIDDVDMEKLLPYSELRKVLIKTQIVNNYIKMFLSSANEGVKINSQADSGKECQPEQTSIPTPEAPTSWGETLYQTGVSVNGTILSTNNEGTIGFFTNEADGILENATNAGKKYAKPRFGTHIPGF